MHTIPNHQGLETSMYERFVTQRVEEVLADTPVVGHLKLAWRRMPERRVP